jgi:hypothetical protein
MNHKMVNVWNESIVIHLMYWTDVPPSETGENHKNVNKAGNKASEYNKKTLTIHQNYSAEDQNTKCPVNNIKWRFYACTSQVLIAVLRKRL